MVTNLDEILSKKNHLFLIGISEYQFVRKLNNCVIDCVNFKNVLVTLFSFEKSRIIELYDENATRGAILDTLEYYTEKLTANDNLIIYFSGHGRVNKFNDYYEEGYWIPVDAHSEKSSQQISTSEIWVFLKAIQTLHTLIIMDCCYSGHLFERSKSIEERVVNTTSRWGLASGRNEQVLDDSIFNKAIIDVLVNNKEPLLRVSELISKVERMVSEKSKQTPIGLRLTKLNDKGGEFVFVSKEKKDKYTFDYIESFNKMLRKPEAIDWLYAGRHLHQVIGDLSGAQLAFETSINLQPDLFDAYLELYYVLILKNELEKCKQISLKGLEVLPNHVVLTECMALANFLIAVENKDKAGIYNSLNLFEKAIALYESSIEVNKTKRSDFYYNAGWAYIEIEEYGKGLNHFKSALELCELERSFSSTYCGLSICHLNLGQVKEAKTAYYQCSNYNSAFLKNIDLLLNTIYLRFHTKFQISQIKKAQHIFLNDTSTE